MYIFLNLYPISSQFKNLYRQPYLIITRSKAVAAFGTEASTQQYLDEAVPVIFGWSTTVF